MQLYNFHETSVMHYAHHSYHNKIWCMWGSGENPLHLICELLVQLLLNHRLRNILHGWHIDRPFKLRLQRCRYNAWMCVYGVNIFRQIYILHYGMLLLYCSISRHILDKSANKYKYTQFHNVLLYSNSSTHSSTEVHKIDWLLSVLWWLTCKWSVHSLEVWTRWPLM